MGAGCWDGRQQNKGTNILCLMIPNTIVANIRTDTSLCQIYFQWSCPFFSYFALDIFFVCFSVNNITFLFPHICTVFTFHKKNKSRHQSRCYTGDNPVLPRVYSTQKKQNNHTSTLLFLHWSKDKRWWRKCIATRTSSSTSLLV